MCVFSLEIDFNMWCQIIKLPVEGIEDIVDVGVILEVVGEFSAVCPAKKSKIGINLSINMWRKRGVIPFTYH